MKKKIKIRQLDSDFKALLIAAKSSNVDRWEDVQKNICIKYNDVQEQNIINEVAEKFGINPSEYNNEKLEVIIDAIWVAAQDYIITLY